MRAAVLQLAGWAAVPFKTLNSETLPTMAMPPQRMSECVMLPPRLPERAMLMLPLRRRAWT